MAVEPGEPFREKKNEGENIDETEALVASSNRGSLELDAIGAGNDDGRRSPGGECRPSPRGIAALLVLVAIGAKIVARTPLGHAPSLSPSSWIGTGPVGDVDGPAAVRARQVEAYREGRALLLSLHITHHAGTQFCHAMRQVGPTPSFACGGGDNWPANLSNHHPWGYGETTLMAKEIRSYFHMIQWEYGYRPRGPLERVNWESPRLASVIIMKHPMKRLLSGGGMTNRAFGTLEERTAEQWLAFSESRYTNNYALNVLMPDGCLANGGSTTAACLESAKDLVSRFTFVLDVECLEEGVRALSEELRFNHTSLMKDSLTHVHPPVRDRIGNDTIYFKLLERNRRDIELYEWSKNLSLVNCDATR